MIYNDLGLVDAVTGLEVWDERRFTLLWQDFVERQIERDERMNLIDGVVRGRWAAYNVNDDGLVPKSPNIIQVGLEDTAAAAAMVPTVRVASSRPDQERARKRSNSMELLGASKLDQAGGKLFFQQSSVGLGAYGFASWWVTDPVDGDLARIEWREPASCYPEPDVGTLGVAQRGFFARTVYITQLPAAHQDAVIAWCVANDKKLAWFNNNAVTLFEYSDCERVTIAIAFDASRILDEQRAAIDGATNWVSVILDDYRNDAGMCRVIYGQLPSLDGQARGQYDQVIPVLHSHIRLVAAALEHAHQSVYNELVVIDPLQNEIPTGPDAVIELGPNGKAFRLPPASVGFSFFEETQRLLDAVHVGARWPKNRPGDVQQSQASSKFVESTLGVQNAVIASHHTLFERMCAQALRACFVLDARHGPEKAVAGATRNQQFQLEFRRADVDLGARVSVEYGLGFGRDVAQSAVLAIQLRGAEIISLEDAQENYPGIVDVARTRSRILGEKIEAQLLAKLLMMSESGEIDPESLIKMRRDIRKGDELDDVFERYVVKPMKERQEGMLTSGLDGSMLPPGPMPTEPGMGGPMPPDAPPPGDILAGILGGGGGAPEPMSRLSVPLGNGSFAGSQMG